jgi:hypothetical protein
MMIERIAMEDYAEEESLLVVSGNSSSLFIE